MLRSFKGIYIAAICLILPVITGCIRDSKSDCPGIVVRVEVATAGDEPAIEDVMLYIFDENGRFLDSLATELGRDEPLFFPGTGTLTVVAWCNTRGGAVNVSPLTGSSTFSDGAVSLKRMPGSSLPVPMDLYHSPDDLFFGSVIAANNLLSGVVIVPVSRKVGSMNITVRGLPVYTGINDTNFSLVVGTTKNSMDFTARLFGGDAGYLPASGFSAQRDLIAPTFNMFPSLEDESLTIRIYHNNTLIYQTQSNNDGVPIQVVANQTLNVLIDFSQASVIVSLQRTRWGRVFEWEKIFN